MTFHWGLFASGVLLLFLPADRLLSRHVLLRSFDRFRTLENSPRFRPWWWVPLLWLDPLRGFAGAHLLKRSLPVAAQEWANLPKAAYAGVVGVLCIGVTCQVFTRRNADALLAPIGFAVGIVAALTPWAVALVGVTMAFTGMFAFRSFGAFFGVGFAGIGILGVVLGAAPHWLIPTLVVLALPILLAATTDRALELPTRDDSARARPTGPGPRSPAPQRLRSTNTDA